MTVASITGHRPDKIKNWQYVEAQLKHAYHDLRITHVIQGMADGVDQAGAKFAYQMHIPYTAARPWATHMAGSPDEYRRVLNHAHHIHIVDPVDHYTGPWLFHNRNKWMVDNSAVLIAVWDGVSKSGGTWSCMQYAKQVGRPTWLINLKEYKVGWSEATSSV